MDVSELIKISEMASMHGVSRQTLILYDKNGLLTPAYVSENGYRYYSMDQIPRLRLICLLKGMGVPLSEIGGLLTSPTPEGMHVLLEHKRASIREAMAQLRRQDEEVGQLEEIFEHMSAKLAVADIPYVCWLPERRAIFSPYVASEMDVRKLHLTLMDAWGRLLDHGMIPSRGFGSLLRTESLPSDDPLKGAGSLIVLPRNEDVDGLDVIVLPEGDYAVMYKAAMPYDPEPAKRLLVWARSRGLVPEGDVIDSCLLDSVFHTDGCAKDFCRLEVRVRTDHPLEYPSCTSK